MSNIPYTYLIKCVPTGQYYYGVRYSKNCNPNDLWVSYFTSSAYVKNLISIYGKQSFVYEVRKTFTTTSKARKWEESVLKRLNVTKRDLFINKYSHMHFDNKNRIWINNGEISKFVDSACINEYVGAGWKHGRLFTSQHKANLSKSKQGTQGGTNNPMYGKCHSNTARIKMSNTRKGKKRGERFSAILPREIVLDIINAYNSRIHIDINYNPRGRQLTYKGAFACIYAEKYNVTPNSIRNVIDRYAERQSFTGRMYNPS